MQTCYNYFTFSKILCFKCKKELEFCFKYYNNNSCNVLYIIILYKVILYVYNMIYYVLYYDIKLY